MYKKIKYVGFLCANFILGAQRERRSDEEAIQQLAQELQKECSEAKRRKVEAPKKEYDRITAEVLSAFYAGNNFFGIPCVGSEHSPLTFSSNPADRQRKQGKRGSIKKGNPPK